MRKIKKEEWKQAGWFLVISIIVIFLQAVLYYQVKQRVPEDGSFLGIMYDNLYFIWGLTLVVLIILWYIIKKELDIKTKKKRVLK